MTLEIQYTTDMKQFLDLNLEQQRRAMRVARREDMNEREVYSFLVKYAIEEWESRNVDPSDRDDSILDPEQRAAASRET